MKEVIDDWCPAGLAPLKRKDRSAALTGLVASKSPYRIDPRRSIIDETDRLRELVGRELGFVPLSKLAYSYAPWHVQGFTIEAPIVPQIEAAPEAPIMPEIEAAIEASRYILSLPPNWDDEDSPAYDKSTWTAATHFVRRTALRHYEIHPKKQLPAPKITHGPNGSIDIQWQYQDKRSILINVSSDLGHITFFGTDKNDHPLKGALDPDSPNDWLLSWLTS